MRVLAIYQLKGGVGKTATAVNLSALFARQGSPTLLWDLDPQGAATYYFRIAPKVEGGRKVFHDADRLSRPGGHRHRHLRQCHRQRRCLRAGLQRQLQRRQLRRWGSPWKRPIKKDGSCPMCLNSAGRIPMHECVVRCGIENSECR